MYVLSLNQPGASSVHSDHDKKKTSSLVGCGDWEPMHTNLLATVGLIRCV